MTECREEDEDAPSIPEAFEEFLSEAAGEYLRGIVHYDADDFEFVFRRDDFREEYSDEDLASLVADLRLQDVGRAHQESLYHVGDLYCTLRAFDDAIVLHFIQGDDRGTAVSLDPRAARDLTQFIYECLAILDESSDQEIARAPNWMPS